MAVSKPTTTSDLVQPDRTAEPPAQAPTVAAADPAPETATAGSAAGQADTGPVHLTAPSGTKVTAAQDQAETLKALGFK